MRRTTPSRQSSSRRVQRRLDFVAPARTGVKPRFEAETITRYRVALLREGSTPYDAPPACERPEAVVRFLHGLLETYDREVVGALLLDARNRAIGHHIAYVGTLTRAIVEPRGILVPALLANASGIILFHNHPSGDPTPSAEDLLFTRRLVEAGEVVGVTLIDHLVIGERPRWISLKERGAF